MTVHAQNSCTLSHITDVQAVYTYYYLASSDITSNMAPKDNVNAPGASTIRITYNGVNYDWTLTEPTLNIIDDVIQTAVGKLYFMECTLFSDSTYDWGPLMTSSTYAAAKAAYNLSSQALANASAAKAVTDLMGGHFIYGNAIPHTSTSAGARVVEQIEEDDVDLTTTPSKWHHNVNIGANGIQLRYNEAVMAQLAANQSGNNTALKFYKPPSVSGNTTTQGTLAMELSGSALKFYASDGATAQAEFGGTKARVSGTIQALDGQIGNNSNNYWYIGNYIDYNQNQSAAIKSHGTAFIQLGDNNTWRLATNRFHSAWNDDSSGTSGQLHYPVYDSKYWDSGLHLPTSTSDKFLYIRNAPNTQTLENLQNDLEDSGYEYWTYRFYVKGDGSLYARNLYIVDDNGNITAIGGADGAYLLKSGGTITGNLEVNGTLTKGNKNVAYLSATPANGQILIADGTTGGIKTSGYTIATSVPSGALFTDKNVQTSQANTTKIYLTGTSTSGTNTGTLNYDSNVYLTTTAGTLHATTFEGNLSGTATKANQDGDGNVIKTTYLKLSGGNVTGPVSFGSSVNVDELTAGDLVVNGAASFTNNLQANTINGVAVGSSPKFTDTVTTVTTSGNGNAITAITASNGKLTVTKGTTFLTSYTETDPVFKASAAYGISSADISNWNSKTSNIGTVTSVRVQASSPLTSTTSTASSTTLDTTIKFANQNKNLILAGPSSGDAAAPTFRSLVADDIPGLAWNKITSGKPTTLSGYGITDAAGLNALVGLSASSNSAGVTTFTATRASGTNPLSFEVSIVASAAAGANALRDSEGPISKGSVTKPVYFNNGVPAEANTYAGGTAVTLNNASKASSTASFYAPTSGGTTSQVLVGNGTTSAPTWKAISDIVPSKASTADAFSSAAEVKLTGDTTGSASSTKGWSITTKTDRISTVGDNRAVATTPNDYVNKMIFQGLKTNSSFDSPSTDTYSYVVGLRGWSDSSGGDSHEFAFNNSGINHRSGATTSWGAWEKLVTSANYTDYTVTKTGSGASGTWGINISGNAGTATKATQDSDGNPINTTYLKKTTYEYNKELSFGSSGKLLIGKFQCYDSNVTIHIQSTTDITYNAIAILATQNINTTGGGTFTWEVYGDANNKVTPNLYAKYASGSDFIEIYFSPSSWSKNLIHIQCLGLRSAPTNLCESVTAIPETANRQPTNMMVTKTGTGASGTWGISISGTAARATNDGDGNAINTTYLKKSGGTMTGVLNALANQYTDSYSGALNMNNSNIYGVNSIYTADLSDNSQEGIHFYRTSTTVDTIYAKNGDLYFVPNRALGSNGTSYTVLHTGNYTSTLNNKYVTIDTDQTITASQKTFNGATRWGTASKYGAVHYDSTLDAIVFSFA